MLKELKKMFFAFTQKERVIFFIALGISFISFVVVMNVVIARATMVVPAAGGEYAEGTVGQPEYVNPVTATTETDLGLVKMIFSNLYDIADKVDVSPDGRTWTVRLKENLHWQDGEKITSDDVIFTVQSIEDPDAASPLYQSWQGVAASRVSELELQFSLANPYAFFGDNLKNLYIIPKHLFASAPPGNWRLSDYNLKPIGSGPYEFVSYGKEANGVISAYHLKAWHDYFGVKALIDQFNMNFFANTSNLIKSFNAGEIDAIGGIGAENLSSIGRPYDLFSWRTPSYYAIFFNQSKNLPLQDDAVRQSLSSAVDRETLVHDILGGQGEPSYGPIPQDAPYFMPVAATASLEFASETLDAAGWKMGADGFRIKTIQKTIIPLALNLTVPKIDFLTKTANALADRWKSIGVKVNLSTDSPANLINGTVKNRDYESLLFGNILGPSSDLFAFWDSSQRFSPGLNLAIYQDKQVDTLIAAARRNLDGISRAKQFADAQNAIAAAYPAIFLYSPNYLYVTRKNVQGIQTSFLPSPSDRFRTVETWYLNTARILK